MKQPNQFNTPTKNEVLQFKDYKKLQRCLFNASEIIESWGSAYIGDVFTKDEQEQQAAMFGELKKMDNQVEKMCVEVES